MQAAKKVFSGILLTLILLVHIISAVALFQPKGFSGDSAPKQRQNVYEGGWSGPASQERDPFLQDRLPSQWRGKGEGETRLLYRDYEAVHGHSYEPRAQGSAPSCVGQATAAAVDILAAVEIHSLGHPERAPPAKMVASIIYGLSRQEIGEVGPMARGGSRNLWAAQALQKYGAVVHANYGLIGYDLSEPSPRQCVIFGSDGVPHSLEEIAKLHPVYEYIKIDSYEELRDAVNAGCPVIIGSNVGFGSKSGRTRDRDGFLSPPRRRWFPSIWKHSMVCIAVADEGRRGALILNSWGADWIVGPKRFGDEPDGSFFADWYVIDRMVKQGDSFALVKFKGWNSYQLWNK